MTETTITPYKTSIVVNATKDRAFKVFSEGMDRWWPRKHSIVGPPQKQTVMECHEGGRWYEVAEDGSTCQWGKVLTWSPPDRLILAWNIDEKWQYNPEFLSEIEITFADESENRTVVHLEHRFLDANDAGAAQMRKEISSEQGWKMVLALYSASV